MSSLGIDLGGTNARAGLVDADGRIVTSAKTELSDRSPESVVEAIRRAVDQVRERSKGVPVSACGIGVAGMLRPNGVVAVAPNLGWRDLPFGSMLEAALGMPVRVVNDLSAAAWGELRAGAGRGSNDLYVVFVGSGVGSSIISGGRLSHGATGIAGELGHIKVVPGGRLCGCGERGCLEAYVGGHNLHEQMREAVARYGASTKMHALSGGKDDNLRSSVLEQAALAGDQAAKEIYEPAAHHLGLAVANQVTVLNPGRLILGGGVLFHCPGLVARVERDVREFTHANALAAVQVKVAELRDDAGLIGAALLAREQ